MEKETAVLGVVMAGGQSRRMAQDKAMLQHPSAASFLSFSIGLFEEIGLEVVVSGPLKKVESSEMRIISDLEGEKGPLAGLNAVFSACPHQSILVIPVDMPALTSEVLSFMLSKPLKNNSLGRIYSAGPATAHRMSAGFYPFPLFLSPLAQPFIREALAQQKWALMPLLESLNLETIPLKTVWEAQMHNVNTPQDLRSFYDTPGR